MDYEGLRGQSAIEYLMTYGWMLLVVAVVGGAIFSVVGDQSIESVQGFNSNDVVVDDFGMTASSLQMSMGAYSSDSVILRKIRIEEADQKISIPMNEDISARDNSIINLPHFKQSEGSNRVNIELIYDSHSLENLSTTGTVIGSIELDNSLKGFWTLNEDQANETHIFDLSGNDNSGEVQGSPSFVSSDKAMSFDGDNEGILIENAVERIGLDGEEEVTVMAQVYPELINGEESRYVLDSWSGIRLHVDRSWTTDWQGYVRVDSETQSGSRFETLEESEWHTMLYTYDGENVKSYGDGVLGGQSSADTGQITHNEDELIFAHGAYIGKIKNIYIFSRDLSDDEITGLHNEAGLISD